MLLTEIAGPEKCDIMSRRAYWNFPRGPHTAKFLRLTCITNAGIILNLEYSNFYIPSDLEVPPEKDYGR